jgi:MFS transporter, ACS family, D-galactonate transporter
MRDFNLSASAMGFLLSAFFWTYGACQLPAGWIIDRFGIKRSYFLAFLLWSLASASVSLSRNVETVFALRLVLGLAESIGPLASLAFIRHAFSEQERGLPVAIYIAGQNIGPACGTLLGTALLATAGWRTMFAVTGLGALLWLPFWARFANRDKSGPTQRPSGVIKTWRWSHMLSSPAFWAMSLCVFLFSYYWYFFLTWIPTYLTVSRGFAVMTMGRILFVPLFIMAPANIGIGWLADRMIARGKSALAVRITIAVAGLAGAGAILLLTRVPNRSSVLAVLIVSVCSFGVASANFWAVVQHLCSAHVTARIIGYFNTLSQIAGVAAPIITGYTLGPDRDFTVAILLAGASTLAAAGLLLSAGTRGLDRLRQALIL